MTDTTRNTARTRKMTIATTTEGQAPGVVQFTIKLTDTPEPLVYLVDINKVPQEYLLAIATQGIIHRLHNIGSAIKPDQNRQAVIDAEMQQHVTGMMLVRSAPAVKSTLIVRAWIIAAGDNPDDRATVMQYNKSWDALSEEGKEAIRTNTRIAYAREQLRADVAKSEMNVQEPIPAPIPVPVM